MLQNYDQAPSAESSFLDKIAVEVSGWRIGYDSEEDLTSFFHCLKRPTGMQSLNLILPPPSSDLIDLGDGDDGGWLFVNPRRTGGRRTIQVVKKSDNDVVNRPLGTPLFGGKATFYRIPNPESGQNLLSASMLLTLNPTRFADYHPNGPPYYPYVPRRGRYRCRTGSLDGNDNLLRGDALNRYSVAGVWRGMRNDYFSLVLHVLEQEMTRAAEYSGCRFSSSSRAFTLKDTEVYWEKESENALEELEELLPTLTQLGRQANVGNYPETRQTRTRNCPSVSVQLANGVTLRVYAKTHLRIRYEIAYKLREYSGMGSSADGLDDLLSLIDQLSLNASRRMSSIFQRFGEAEDVSEGAVTLEQFLSKLNASAGYPSLVTEVLAILIHTRSFIPTSRQTRAVATKLKNKGVLEAPVGRNIIPNPYTLTPPYRDLFDLHFPRPSVLPDSPL